MNRSPAAAGGASDLDAFERVPLLPSVAETATYQPPLETVCGYCGRKHYGPFEACSRCQNAANRGE